MIRSNFNGFRYEGGSAGHYESYFQRANHPTRKLAFWIRYTLFAPKGRPRDAVGELWAIYFDGERKRITPVKVVVPYSRCLFSSWELNARIDEILRGPLEERLVGEHRQARGACALVRRRDRRGIEALAQHALAGARLLDLGDHGSLAGRDLRAQRALEAARRRRCACFFGHPGERTGRLRRTHFFRLHGNDTVEYVAACHRVPYESGAAGAICSPT